MALQPWIEPSSTSPSNAITSTEDTSCTPVPALLRLPRELRDLIYEYYVWVDGGYIYNPETGKLAPADGSSCALSLGLACQQLASELKGAALRSNTLTFETSFSEALREDAGMSEIINYNIACRKKDVTKIFTPRLFTSAMTKALADTYPQLSPVLGGWGTLSQRELRALTKQNECCGEAPSIWRDCINDVLRQVVKHQDLDATLLEDARTRYGSTTSPVPWIPATREQMLRLVESDPIPWRITSKAERDDLAAVAQVEPRNPYYFSRTKYTYSAACLALHFLQGLSEADLAAVRTISLRENHEGVAFPECHARGLIPICRQNPKIRVQRFASLWKCVFPISQVKRMDYTYVNQEGLDSSSLSHDRLQAEDITRAVGKWLKEASALPSLGMPEGSFTLILDGNPTPDYTAKPFQVVQRDVAFQDALDFAYAAGSLPTPTWLARRLRTGYMYEGLADIVRSLSMDSPLIRCNFDPGQPHDAEEMARRRRGWNADEWKISWPGHSPREFQTEAPLPPWHELRWQYAIM